MVAGGPAPARRTPITAAAGDLERFGADLLVRAGASAEDAAWVASCVVASDLAGHESHGMRRLVEYTQRALDGTLDPAAVPEIVEDQGSTAIVDGRHTFGHVSMRVVTDEVVARARAHGIAAVALRGSDHVGRLADFCELAASQGIVMLCFVNDAGSFHDVAPPGGTEGRISTNPIAAGVPRVAAPHLVLDMATSVVARGRVSEWEDRGEPIPPEWVTSTGFLRPVGGVKGFGLALVAEALGGGLTGAGTVSAAPSPEEQGVFAIGIDVARFRPLAGFAAEVEGFIGYVKDVPLEPGAAPVRVPGETGAAIAAERRAHGVPVQPFTWERLAVLAERLGVPMPPRLDT
jgi:LDH2 family malate/lactate/ureidoglycolate dehydrogenase